MSASPYGGGGGIVTKVGNLYQTVKKNLGFKDKIPSDPNAQPPQFQPAKQTVVQKIVSKVDKITVDKTPVNINKPSSNINAPSSSGSSSRSSGGSSNRGSGSSTVASPTIFNQPTQNIQDGGMSNFPDKNALPTSTQPNFIPNQGGYFIDPKTNQGISSGYDLTKKGYVRTATPLDIQNKETESQGGVVYGKRGVEEYNKEVERIQSVQSKVKYLNSDTGVLSNTQNADLSEQIDFNKPKPYQIPVWVDQSGNAINDLGEYLKENKIPYSEENKNPKVKDLSFDMTQDIKSLSSQAFRGDFGKGGLKVGNEWLPSESAYGYVSAVTPTDVTLLISPSVIASKPLASLGILTSVAETYGKNPPLSALNIIESKRIVEGTTGAINFGTDFIFGEGNSIPKQIVKGLSYKATLPYTGIAYTKEIGTAFVKDPTQTTLQAGKYIIDNPFEVLAMSLPYKKLMTKTPIEIKYNQIVLTDRQLKMMGKISPLKDLNLKYVSSDTAQFLQQKFLETGEKIIIKEGRQTIWVKPYKEILSNIVGIKNKLVRDSYLGNPKGGVVTMKTLSGFERNLIQGEGSAIINRRLQIKELIDSGISKSRAKDMVKLSYPQELKYELSGIATVTQVIGKETLVNIMGIEKVSSIKEKTVGVGKKWFGDYYAEVKTSGRSSKNLFIENLIKEQAKVDKKFIKVDDINKKSFYEGIRETYDKNKKVKRVSVKYLIKNKNLIELNPKESSVLAKVETVKQISLSQPLTEKLNVRKIANIEASSSNTKIVQPYKSADVFKKWEKLNQFDIKSNKKFEQVRVNEYGELLTGEYKKYLINLKKIKEASPIPTEKGFMESYKEIYSSNINFEKEAPKLNTIIKPKFKKPSKIIFTDKSGYLKQEKINLKINEKPVNRIFRKITETINQDKLELKQLQEKQMNEFAEYQKTPEYKSQLEKSKSSYYSGLPLDEVIQQAENIFIPTLQPFSFTKSFTKLGEASLQPQRTNIMTGFSIVSAEKTSSYLQPIMQTKEENLIRMSQMPRITLEPKIESRIELQPKVESRADVKANVRANVRVEPKVEVKVEARVEPKLEPRLEPRVQSRPSLTPRIFIEPKIKEPRFLLPSPKINISKLKKGRYQTEVREKGKFKSIGIEEDIIKASKKGERSTLKNLSASFRIKNLLTGKYEKPIKSKLFRESKSNKLIAVQKEFRTLGATGRISSSTEKAQIKRSKKIKVNKYGGIN